MHRKIQMYLFWPVSLFYCFTVDASRALPDFVELDLGQSNTENISSEDVKALQSLYREHCEVGQPFQSLNRKIIEYKEVFLKH